MLTLTTGNMAYGDSEVSMETKLGARLSYTWRSIWSSIEALRKGLVMCIGMVVDQNYRCCENGLETLEHALFWCNNIADAWHYSHSCKIMTFHNLISLCGYSESVPKLDGPMVETCHTEGTQRQARSNNYMQWRKPQHPFVKLNMDPSIDGDSVGGTGGVLRDEEGHFLCAWVTKIQNADSSETLEAMAVQDGLALLKSSGYMSAVIEADAQTILMALKENRTLLSPTGLRLDDIMEMVKGFLCICFRRKTDRVAHLLANKGNSLVGTVYWMDLAPSFVVDALIFDAK
ncbi:hypothetical protein L6164_021055 [Bauhinia variegata]|uniref:Uncharacterized protein n=1 Tax=Bauhinia variegata TaxID=167791 RepID=A0ACB9MYG5_BAUVA|nr:hypothetical protein L6164_021055 [Bauhinia variegata]